MKSPFNVRTLIAVALLVPLVFACGKAAEELSKSPQDVAAEIAIIPPEDHVPVAPPEFVNPYEMTRRLKEAKRGEELAALMRGRIPDKALFPASIWIGNCSATLVGPRGVLTAAHCVGRSGVGFTVDGTRYSAPTCRISKYYRGNSTADFAVCVVNRDVVGVAQWETIDLDGSDVQVGGQILLSGYGCQRWGGGIDGHFRIGESEVIRLPRGTNYDTVTRDGSAICSGDSGGAAWTLTADGKRKKVLSVNSRSDTTVTSMLSSLYTSEGKRFIEAVLTLHPELKICGTSREPENCLVAGPGEPDPDPEPQPDVAHFFIDHPLAAILGAMKPGQAGLLEKAREAVEKALEEL